MGWCDNQNSCNGMEVGDMGVGRTEVGQVYAGVYESVDQFITAGRHLVWIAVLRGGTSGVVHVEHVQHDHLQHGEALH